MEDQSRKKVQYGEEMMMDRFSNLPDQIIYHILSLMDTKHAVQTCSLSKKWKDHWTHIHSLNFDSTIFKKTSAVRKFVEYVLRHRESFNLHRLRFICRGKTSTVLSTEIFDYAKSHNIEELETDLFSFPPSFSKCETLRTLRLMFRKIYSFANSTFGISVSSLTTLQFHNVKFSSETLINDLLSNCLNLENLLISSCKDPMDNLNISTPAPRLVNLTISGCCLKTLAISATQLVNLTIPGSFLATLNISAPQLISLSISDIWTYSESGTRSWKLVMSSAPKLKFIDFIKTKYPPILSMMDECPNLEKVNIHMIVRHNCHDKERYQLDLASMAEGLSHAKSLTVTLNDLSDGIDNSWKFISRHSSSDKETEDAEHKKEIGNDKDVNMARKNLGRGGFSLKWQMC